MRVSVTAAYRQRFGRKIVFSHRQVGYAEFHKRNPWKPALSVVEVSVESVDKKKSGETEL